MLQLLNIRKEYKTGGFVQKALDGVSVGFRDNEFVAILGPSGSGKSTLLNIIGGLDRYDEGDLIINHISTKKYKDADWDSYRNHTIGFVSQSYNLIPHQTILSNVELALTISGISAAERKKRAQEALEKVGLGDQTHKKPNQLSGGQMQRVAVARALVNDPDILLADEPTGALDTKTSLQIMDLLKEVAKDRLVIMVTHNPDLAEQYATRIVRIQDGKVISDTDPVETDEKDAVHKNMGHASMSLLTSLSLSFQNLLTKRNRTILTAFAGSIGIIGIALILSLSTGANRYIEKTEENALSEYPISISSSGVNTSSLIDVAVSSVKAHQESEVSERKTLGMFFAGTEKNDLGALKRYFDGKEQPLDGYVKAIEYTYGVTPNIYKINDGKPRQVNPDQVFSAYSNSLSILSSFTSMSTTGVFNVLPQDQDLYRNSFDVKAGRWPENKNELVLVLAGGGTLSDVALYAAGLKDPAKLDEMIQKYMNNEYVESDTEVSTYKYTDFIGLEFKVLNVCDLYTYDAEYGVYVDRSKNEGFLEDVLSRAESLTVVGVVMSNGEDSSLVYPGFNYLPELTYDTMQKSAESAVVKAQLANPDINVFTGKPFGESGTTKDFDLFSFVSFDASAFEKLFSIDPETFDFSTLDFSKFDLAKMDFSSIDLEKMLKDPSMDLSDLFTEDEVREMMSHLSDFADDGAFNEIIAGVFEGFSDYLKENYTEEMQDMAGQMAEFARSEEVKKIVENYFKELYAGQVIPTPDKEKIQELSELLMEDFLAYAEEHKDADRADIIRGYFVNDSFTEIAEQFMDEYIQSQAEFPKPDMEELSKRVFEGYQLYADEKGYFAPEEVMKAFNEFLSSEAVRERIQTGLSETEGYQNVKEYLDGILQEKMSELSGRFTNVIKGMMGSLTVQITNMVVNMMTDAVTQMTSRIKDSFTLDPESLKGLVKFQTDAQQLRELFSSMFNTNSVSYSKILSDLNYGSVDEPSSVSIYPVNFEAKNKVVEVIDNYNKSMKDNGEENKVIHYADYVGNLMSSVTEIVDVISYVLIAFVAVSLVVSSIMIGIITYVSVIERTREIGILRALGASKRNIANVFNAETFIIGFLAGLFGVGLTWLILIPGNMLLKALTDGQDVQAVLPVGAAAILVVISIILTLIGGFLPARKASKMDPVAALRTE